MLFSVLFFYLPKWRRVKETRARTYFKLNSGCEIQKWLTMTKKSLSKKIERKLSKLHELLDKMDEARAINPDDPETWDSDTLYDLVENLKEVLKILEDQKIEDKYDEFGQPLTEDGLCSLVDNCQEEE